jgi:hypothetical protein
LLFELYYRSIWSQRIYLECVIGVLKHPGNVSDYPRISKVIMALPVEFLVLVIRERFVDLALQLIGLGIPIEMERFKDSPLAASLQINSELLISRLLGEDISTAKCVHGESAIVSAAASNRISVLERLLVWQQKTNPEILRRIRTDGFPPVLCVAVFQGHLEVVSLLLKHGFSTDGRYSLTQIRSIRARPSSFDPITWHSSDPGNSTWKTPLELAVLERNLAMTTLLVEANAPLIAFKPRGEVSMALIACRDFRKFHRGLPKNKNIVLRYWICYCIVTLPNSLQTNSVLSILKARHYYTMPPNWAGMTCQGY